MADEHECEKSSCESALRTSLFINCNKCNAKCYLKCLYRSNDEIFDLLYAFKFLIKANSDGNTGASKQEYKWNTNDNLMKRFQSVFGADKLFRFICRKCKIESENDDEMLRLKSTCDQLSLDITALQNQVKEKDAQINSMIEMQNKPNEINEQKLVLVNTITKTVEVMKLQTSALLNLCSEIDQNTSGDVIVDRHINAAVSEANVNKNKTTNKLNRKSKHPISDIRYHLTRNDDVDSDGDLEPLSDASVEIDDAKDVVIPPKKKPNPFDKSRIIFSDALMPETNQKKKFAAHISKLPMCVNIEDIVDHVINNTDIDFPDLFEVELLGNSNADYRSFKISSSTIEHHLMIMSIWSPHYTARDFLVNKPHYTVSGRSVRRPQSQTVRQAQPNQNRNQMKRQQNGYNRRVNATNQNPQPPRFAQNPARLNNFNRMNNKQMQAKKQPTVNNAVQNNQIGTNDAQQPTYFIAYPAQKYNQVTQPNIVATAAQIHPQSHQNTYFLGSRNAPAQYVTQPQNQIASWQPQLTTIQQQQQQQLQYQPPAMQRQQTTHQQPYPQFQPSQ